MAGDNSRPCGPSTLWVMAGADDAPHGIHPVTPLPAALTAAGLVSGVRLGAEAVAQREPHVAQWDAIREHYQQVADWIRLDLDYATDGRAGGTAVADFLGMFNRRADITGWLSGSYDYWITAGECVDAALTAVAEFQREYEYAATVRPLNIYRRNNS